MRQRRWEIAGSSVGVAGLVIAVLPWLSDKLNMTPPHWVLVVLLVLASVMVIGGVGLALVAFLWPVISPRVQGALANTTFHWPLVLGEKAKHAVERKALTEGYERQLAKLGNKLQTEKVAREKAEHLAQAFPGTQEERRKLVAYEEILNTDQYHLTDRVHIHKFGIDDHLDPVQGGWVDFWFDVFNGTILTAKVGYSVMGFLIINSKKPHDDTEPGVAKTILHGEGQRIAIRQRLLPNVATEIMNEAQSQDGTDFRIEFTTLYISLESKTPLGFDGPNRSLIVPPMQKYRVRQDGPMTGLYRWELVEATNMDGSPWK